MTTATIINHTFHTDTFFPEWSTVPEKVFFTSDDLAAVARSLDDFKHGRALTAEDCEADILSHINSLYDPSV